MLAATADRVPAHTADAINRRIHRQIETAVAYFADHPQEIGPRLQELDAEWDVERAIETEAASTVLTGLALGAVVDRRWFLLPAFASAMLLRHNLHGWYPMLPLFRRLGLRTQSEIAAERYALKALRGDFQPIQQQASGHGWDRAQAALAAVQA